MNIDELKRQADEEISALIADKIAELRKHSEKEVSEIELIPRGTMTGLAGYDVRIKLI